MNSPSICAIHKSVLQSRIKEACQGCLRWCFNRDVFLAQRSWPPSETVNNGLKSQEDDPDLKSFTGSLNLLKVYEFSQVTADDKVLVRDYLQACANM